MGTERWHGGPKNSFEFFAASKSSTPIAKNSISRKDGYEKTARDKTLFLDFCNPLAYE